MSIKEPQILDGFACLLETLWLKTRTARNFFTNKRRISKVNEFAVFPQTERKVSTRYVHMFTYRRHFERRGEVV